MPHRDITADILFQKKLSQAKDHDSPLLQKPGFSESLGQSQRLRHLMREDLREIQRKKQSGEIVPNMSSSQAPHIILNSQSGNLSSKLSRKTKRLFWLKYYPKVELSIYLVELGIKFQYLFPLVYLKLVHQSHLSFILRKTYTKYISQWGT